LENYYAFNIASPYGSILVDLKKIRDYATEIHFDISQAFADKLNADELINLLARIRISMEEGTFQIDKRTIDILKNKLKDLKSGVKKELEKGKDIEVEVPVTLSVRQQEEIGEQILKLELDRIKATGALESQLLLAEKTLAKQLGLSRTNLDLVKKELEYQYALTQEKKNQTKLQSDTIILFKIAQTHGTETAKRIGDLLSGDIDLSDFGRRYKDELEVVKKEFKSFFENATSFAIF